MRTKKFKSSLIYIFVFLFSLIFVFNSSMAFAFAESIEYTNVLTDLQKDESFDIESFPELENDYSLQVIQIAESVNQELFIYVYQPSGETKNLVATEIRFSIDNETWKDYGLELLSSFDTLFKYKVKDFVVSNEDVRTYNLTAIFRKWDETIDEPATGDNTIDYVSFEIGQLWTAKSTEDEVEYDFVQTDVIEITDKYVGKVQYLSGWKWVTYFCDSHYIAFSTDKKIENLVEAEVSFKTCGYVLMYDVPGSVVYGDNIEEKTVVLTNNDIVENQIVGLFGQNHDWNRIETTNDFLSNEVVDDDVKENVEKMQWVLRFFESEYSHHGGNLGNLVGSGTAVKEVSILRLKFETDGVSYNLGVVDNKQTGSISPDNDWRKSWWKENGWIVILILAIIIAIPLLPFILWLLKIVLKAIWWLITLPFEIFK